MINERPNKTHDSHTDHIYEREHTHTYYILNLYTNGYGHICGAYQIASRMFLFWRLPFQFLGHICQPSFSISIFFQNFNCTVSIDVLKTYVNSPESILSTQWKFFHALYCVVYSVILFDKRVLKHVNESDGRSFFPFHIKPGRRKKVARNWLKRFPEKRERKGGNKSKKLDFFESFLLPRPGISLLWLNRQF